MNYIYIIAFCLVFSTQIQRWRIFQTKLLKRKPFTCELCMSFWLTFAYQWYVDRPLAFAFVMALIVPVALQLYNKILRCCYK